MEFHPVILAGGRGSRMYPLTEDCPKALLPVGNRPLIWYPVQLLERNGFEESTVVVRESQAQQISEVLEGFQTRHGVRMKFSLVEIPDHEDWGTADSLRQVRTKVKGQSDVLVMSCDVVTTIPLHLLTDHHCCHASTLTALLVTPPKPTEEQTKKGRHPIERDLVGLSENSQLVYFASLADLDEDLPLSRAMLKRHPHIRICSHLTDAHVYLLKRWVLDYLAENRSLFSVKGELVPHLVKHQSMEITPSVPQSEEGRTASVVNRQALQSAAKTCVDELEQLAYKMSSFAGLPPTRGYTFTEKLIRCHAVVADSHFCVRVNTLPTFVDANKMVPQLLKDFQLEGEAYSSTRGKGISSDSLVGGGSQVADKASVKHSVVGQHCSIGDKSKIINCVLMDYVHVGEGCTLQGCVVCSHVRVEDRVSLRDCHVGANFTVTKEADVRGETLVLGGGTMDF